MASGKKNAPLSSLAAYGDDSEQESDTDTGETEQGGLVSADYGEYDVSRVEEGDSRISIDEDSRDSSRNSEEEESDPEPPEAHDGKTFLLYPEVEMKYEEGRPRTWTCPCQQESLRAPVLLKTRINQLEEAANVHKYSEIPEGEKKDPNELVAQFSERVRNMSPDEIRIPPEPPGRCSNNLQEKIQKLYERKLHGDIDTNSHIQNKKEFRNPSIYEKLIQYCGIDELGTNYPKDMFDPHGWSEDSYYEALAKAQKVEMDKLEKAKKERTKEATSGGLSLFQIEFVTGTKKGTTTNAAATTSSTASTTAADAQKRKSKWDSAVPVSLAQPTILTTTATLPAVVSVTTTASGTKTTVISAVGTIVKKAKQ
ncbi:SAP30-binding protein-like isoform X2 [Acipenser ruthenus]|uniref:SAP30-binding protein-like isoform X2 n=1 Tax=Acipenser ruthenus TaxID=7906 RepID=UPI00274125EA|nr:SAP30-binding protein-like isoform X2 [Acipenser ruthenus]